MVGDVLALIEFLRKHWEELHVVQGFFDADGNRMEGDEELSVNIHSTDRDNVWFYEVVGPADYVFVHMPVVAGLYADYALRGSKNPDARFFRYVNTPMSASISGGASNVKVSFLVYGYRPTDLLKLRGGTEA